MSFCISDKVLNAKYSLLRHFSAWYMLLLSAPFFENVNYTAAGGFCTWDCSCGIVVIVWAAANQQRRVTGQSCTALLAQSFAYCLHTNVTYCNSLGCWHNNDSVQSRKLLDNSAYHTVYKTIKSWLAAKGERPDASEDLLKNTAGEVMTSRDILRVCQHLMSSNSTAADRDLSLNNWLLSTCGRSDDGRLLFQADICPPKLIKSLGGHAHRPSCMHNLAHISIDCIHSMPIYMKSVVRSTLACD